MRAAAIIAAIAWPEAMDADRRLVVEDAIRALDAKAYGNGRRILGEMDLHRITEAFVKRAGSANAAAEQLGISPAFLSQIRSGTRPAPESVLGQLGLCRAPRSSRERYLEI